MKNKLINLFSKRKKEAGSVFTVLLAGIAMASALSIVLYQTISGPMSSMVRVTNKTVARAQLQSVSNIVIMDALNQASSGDCDGDGSVEPREWRDPPVASAAPGGGGLIPLSIGAPVSDPWGTDYGYCVWDVGTNIKAAGCGGAGAKRLSGTAAPQGGNAVTQTVMAIVSAGPNRQFQTSCRDYVDTTTDTIFPTGTPAASGAGGDDVVQRFTYTEAASATSSIWTLKVGDAATAEINKDLSIGPTATPRVVVSSTTGDITTTGGVVNALAVIASGNITAAGKIGAGSATLGPETLQVTTTTADDGLMLRVAQTAGNTVYTSLLGNLAAGAFNPITQVGDMGLIFGGTAVDTAKGFVIAPWGSTAGGVRIDGVGNVSIPGNLAVTGALSGTFSLTYPTGAIPFGTGIGSTTDASNLYWDDTNNRLGIGIPAPGSLLHAATSTTALGQTFFEQASADTDSWDLSLRKSRGTVAAPEVITTGDELGDINFRGYSGVGGYVTGAAIKGVSEGTVATTRVPANLSFWTGTDEAPTVLTERMRIDSTGNVGIGTATPGFGLDAEKILGATNAKFGATLPVYLTSNNPMVGFNAYYNGGWKFGKGSAAEYGGRFAFDAATGALIYGVSTTGGPADSAATMSEKFTILQNGNVTINGGTGMVIDASSSTGAVRLPQGTTATRPACTAGISGAFRYNTTKYLPEFCDGTGWVFMSIVVPDFNFIDHPSAALASTITSNTVTLGNFATAVATCNAGCTAISINGGAFVAGPVTVHGGDTIAIRQTSSGLNDTTTTATVTIDNTISGIWSVTTIQPQNIQTFNASGSWNKPPGSYSSTATTLIQCWGAGAGGAGSVQNATFAGSGGGGGGGSTNTTVLLSTLGSSQAVVIGAGGTGGNPGPTSGTATRGTVGENTTFAGMTAGGGGIGTIATGTLAPGTGGPGGTAGTGGSVGSNGVNGGNDATGNATCPGAGKGGYGGNAAAAGGTAGGLGGQGGADVPIFTTTIAYPGTTPGGGGGGGAGFATCGVPPGIAGAGAAGKCIITTTDVAQ